MEYGFEFDSTAAAFAAFANYTPGPNEGPIFMISLALFVAFSALALP